MRVGSDFPVRHNFRWEKLLLQWMRRVRGLQKCAILRSRIVGQMGDQVRHLVGFWILVSKRVVFGKMFRIFLENRRKFWCFCAKQTNFPGFVCKVFQKFVVNVKKMGLVLTKTNPIYLFIPYAVHTRIQISPITIVNCRDAARDSCPREWAGQKISETGRQRAPVGQNIRLNLPRWPDFTYWNALLLWGCSPAVRVLALPVLSNLRTEGKQNVSCEFESDTSNTFPVNPTGFFKLHWFVPTAMFTQ